MENRFYHSAISLPKVFMALERNNKGGPLNLNSDIVKVKAVAKEFK